MRFPRYMIIRSVRRMMVAMAVFTAMAVSAQDETPLYGIPILEGRAVLPADTFADGPASGAAIEAANDRTPPFEGQPVQGVSSILPTRNGNYYMMQDNGFGAKNNSADIQAVLQGLNQQNQLDRDHWLKMFNLLREADGVEGFQLEELRKTVLKQHAESERRLPAGDHKNGASTVNGKEEPGRDQKHNGVSSANTKQEPLKERTVGEVKTA